MIYNLQKTPPVQNSADHPRPNINITPLQEVKLAAAKKADKAQFSVKRLGGKGIRFLIIASFQPKGVSKSFISKKYIEAMGMLAFGKELPQRHSVLMFTTLEYAGDIPNEMVFTFHFVPLKGIHNGIVHIRCEDFFAALKELKK